MEKSKTNIDLKKKIETNLEKWDNDQRLSFLEFLTHELTIAVRQIWSGAEFSPAEKVEQMKWINEILHRLPMFAHSLRTGKGDWQGNDIAFAVENCISQSPPIWLPVTYAVLHSIEQTAGCCH